MDFGRDYERTAKSPRRDDYNDDYHTRRRQTSRTPRSRSRHHPRRTWPPPPRVETEHEALAIEYRPLFSKHEEVQSRGLIDQQPLIEDAFPSTSSHVAQESPSHRPKADSRFSKAREDRQRIPPISTSGLQNQRPHFESSSSSESLGPKTPVDPNTSNLDRRYVLVPEKGMEIPITYDEPREPIFEKPTKTRDRDAYGRQSKPVLGLDTSRGPSPTGGFHSERTPLPYNFTPVKKGIETPRMNRFSGEYLQSPDVISPQLNHMRNSPRQVSADPRMMTALKDRSHDPALKRPPRHTRPSMQRHASANAEASGPGPGPASDHSRHSSRHILSSSDSDYSPDEFRKVRKLKEAARRSKSNQHNEDPKTHRKAFSGGATRRGTDSEGSARHTPKSTPPTGTGSAGPALHAANILLTNPHFAGRKASPRDSPLDSPNMSPNASPPGTPPNERAHKGERTDSLRHPLATSKPASPLHSPPSETPKVKFARDTDSRSVRHGPSVDVDGTVRRERSPRPKLPRSRQTSPLPFPGTATVESEPSINVRSPSTHLNAKYQSDVRASSPSGRRRSSSHSGIHPGSIGRSASPSRQRSKTTLHAEDERPSSRHLSLAPFDLPSAPSGKTSEAGARRRAHSSVAGTRPDISDLALSSRRTASKNRRPRFEALTCPRTTPQTGHQDWSITRAGPSSLVICPTCRQTWSSFHDFAYRHLIPAPRSLTEQPTRCTFTDPWNKLAWRELQTMRKPDIDVLYDLADNLVDEEACPDNTATSRRTWYRIEDPSTGDQVSGFDVCGTCFTNIDILWPSSADLFQKSNSRHSNAKRLCALRPSSGRRFGLYTNLLAEMSSPQARASRKSVEETRNLIGLIQELRDIRECRRDKMLEDEHWHIIPSLEEFTVCEDCFEDVVQPAIRQGSSIASKFERRSRRLRKTDPGSRRGSRSEDVAAKPHRDHHHHQHHHQGGTNPGEKDNDDNDAEQIPKLLSCQLYSKRMRTVFAEACKNEDMKLLEDKAWDRYDAERELAYHRERSAGDLDKNGDVERQRERERELRDAEREWKELE